MTKTKKHNAFQVIFGDNEWVTLWGVLNRRLSLATNQNDSNKIRKIIHAMNKAKSVYLGDI